ncbi:rRNA maturation RNase YbeY [Flavobacterium ardleyense]|uniref:rRNA maturation RNase YbeY n=1 Tax=Flavobacterium ardleyense TaxID=2038737 RepID=UPI00298C0535|nr:rRNA maturation RNase YbeY [Flavobacterium ardleyense]
MISYNYESDFTLGNEEQYSQWISSIIESEDKNEGEINYIFCNDDYLHKINMEYLQHDDLTDIISFDYCVGNEINGDIFISVERVAENAKEYEVTLEAELLRVMAHGILHYCGYKDKSEEDAALMRSKENEKMKMFAIN